MKLLRDAQLIKEEILPYFPPNLKKLLINLPDEFYSGLEEIRLRSGMPLILRSSEREYTVDNSGRPSPLLERGYRINSEIINRLLASISDNSIYAFEEEIRRGFITVPGGHRIGLAGQVVIRNNQVKNIKDFSSICVRIAKQVKGCALPLLPQLYDNGQRPFNTLIVSPPRCGKTTILRDMARLISQGEKYPAQNVVIIDERSEIAGSYNGIPQLDVGPRTDVIDACPKDLGMTMALRALSPQVIITDEIGQKGDAGAIQDCINAGVTVITSVHARNLEELEQRPLMKEILSRRLFKRGVILSRRKHPGYVEEIIRWD